MLSKVNIGQPCCHNKNIISLTSTIISKPIGIFDKCDGNEQNLKKHKCKITHKS